MFYIKIVDFPYKVQLFGDIALRQVVEHFENKIIAQSKLFENEIGPVVPKVSVQKKCFLQER